MDKVDKEDVGGELERKELIKREDEPDDVCDLDLK